MCAKLLHMKNSFHVNIAININMLLPLYNYHYYQYHYNYYNIVVKYLTTSKLIINEITLLDNIYHQLITAAKKYCYHLISDKNHQLEILNNGLC